MSGAAKQFHSAVVRRRMVAEQGLIRAMVENTVWVFRDPRYALLVMALVLPWVSLALTGMADNRPNQAFRRLAPFLAGVRYVFYATVFFDSFTRTESYYAPHYFLGALSVGLCSLLLAERFFPAWPGAPAALDVLVFLFSWGGVREVGMAPFLLVPAALAMARPDKGEGSMVLLARIAKVADGSC